MTSDVAADVVEGLDDRVSAAGAEPGGSAAGPEPGRSDAGRSTAGASGPSVLERAARGAAIGLVATMAMSVVMIIIRALGLVDKLAPRLIVESTIAQVAPRGLRHAKPLTVVAHLAFGAGNGAVFGVVGPVVRGSRVAKGIVFATVVLLASYEGWVPAAGIVPPLHRQRAGRATELLAGHAVYGTILGWLAG